MFLLIAITSNISDQIKNLLLNSMGPFSLQTFKLGGNYNSIKNTYMNSALWKKYKANKQ